MAFNQNLMHCHQSHFDWIDAKKFHHYFAASAFFICLFLIFSLPRLRAIYYCCCCDLYYVSWGLWRIPSFASHYKHWLIFKWISTYKTYPWMLKKCTRTNKVFFLLLFAICWYILLVFVLLLVVKKRKRMYTAKIYNSRHNFCVPETQTHAERTQYNTQSRIKYTKADWKCTDLYQSRRICVMYLTASWLFLLRYNGHCRCRRWRKMEKWVNSSSILP